MAIKMMIEDIPIEVKKKRIKNMYLYVKAPGGNVVASVPENASTTDIQRFIVPRIEWIRRHRDKLRTRDAVSERTYDVGETVFIFGEEHKIEIKHAGTQYADTSDGVLTLYMRKGHYKESRERVFREYMRKRLYEKIEERLPIYTEMTSLSPSELQIKDMDTRWGSCNAKTGKIWINLKLANMPVKYLDYILLHELSHLKLHGHGKEFSSFLDLYMKDWRSIKKELNSRYSEFI